MNRRDALKLLSSVIILPKLVGPTPAAAEAHSVDVLVDYLMEPTININIWDKIEAYFSERPGWQEMLTLCYGEQSC